MSAHALHVERQSVPDHQAVVYRLSGVLGETHQCYEFLDELRQAIDDEPRRIVLNMASLEFMTSPGVGIVATCYTSAKNDGKALILCAVPKQVLSVLSVCGLTPVLHIFDTEDEALTADLG